MRALTILGGAAFVAAGAFIIWVPQWNVPPIPATQVAPPPTSQILFLDGQMPEPVTQTAPKPLPAADAGGPRATDTYKNVKVLTDVSAAEFMRLQQAITAWVSPKQGCAFCHTGTDYASDAKPQKLAARLMLQMVRHVNADWGQHVNPSGVTCFTCHRGQPVPAETWFPQPPAPVRPIVAKQENWQEDADNVRKFFPDAGWELYFLDNEPISVQSVTALPGQTVAAQVVTKRIYEMMMQMSDGMGVNCGYCHNTRAFASWAQSTPHRWQGQYGINMTRELNQGYFVHLRSLLPQDRSMANHTAWPVLPAQQNGPQIGTGLLVCATCHLAHPQPLGGVNMVQDYPGLTGPAANRNAAPPAPSAPEETKK